MKILVYLTAYILFKKKKRTQLKYKYFDLLCPVTSTKSSELTQIIYKYSLMET